MTINSPTGLSLGGPKFDLVGPTVDADIRRIIGRYGAEAVKQAVKRETKPKRGRKPEKDWPELRPVIEEDARVWLEGGDPFSTRSNYSIAKQFADKSSGHSHPATMKRIERKLVKQRVWMTLAIAESLSWESYPFAAHIRALEALSSLKAQSVWGSMRDRAKSNVEDYEAKKGEAPPPHLSMKEVEEATRNALLTLATPQAKMGILGLLSSYTPASEGRD